MNRGFGRASLKHEYAPRTAVTADGCVIPAVALELRVLQCRHRCEWFSGTGWSPLGWVGERFAKWCLQRPRPARRQPDQPPIGRPAATLRDPRHPRSVLGPRCAWGDP